MYQLTRSELLNDLTAKFKELKPVLAFWEQGSTAMGRADAWSDLDLQLLVEDGHLSEICEQVESLIESIRPIEIRYVVPMNGEATAQQIFLKLQNTSPYLLIDLSLMERSHSERFMEREIHGNPLILFDKENELQAKTMDIREFANKLQARLQVLETWVNLFHVFVDKEYGRGRSVDAFHFYQNGVLARLIEVLRIRYSPWRYNFGLRYLSYDLPSDIYQKVEQLCFIQDPSILLDLKTKALDLFQETLHELRTLSIEKILEETVQV